MARLVIMPLSDGRGLGRACTGSGVVGRALGRGYGPAQAVKESITRDLSAELAPHGIRVVGLRPNAMLETCTIKNAYEPRAKATG